MSETTWLGVVARWLLGVALTVLPSGCADPSKPPQGAGEIAITEPPVAPEPPAPVPSPATPETTATPTQACEATSPRAGNVEIVVTPDDGDARVLALLNGAKTSIDVTIYQLSSRNVVAALVAAAQRGVKVRVIQDWREANDTTLATLTSAGATVKTSSRAFRYTHQKTVLVDAKTVFVFSGNLDRLSFTSGRNFGVVLDDADDAADFAELFEADWAGRSPSLACTRLVVSPVNARARVLALIDGAKTSLDVEAMYVTDAPVTNAVLAAKARGVTVRVLLNDPSHDLGDSSWAAGRFAGAGIPTKRSGDLFVHAKLLVVDGVHAFVGSENFSDNSLDSNREAGLVVSSPSANLARITTTFEKDWTAGAAF